MEISNDKIMSLAAAWRPEERVLSGNSKKEPGRAMPNKVTFELRCEVCRRIAKKKRVQWGGGVMCKGTRGTGTARARDSRAGMSLEGLLLESSLPCLWPSQHLSLH